MKDAHRRHVVMIVQARMGSVRLPGKVLVDIQGQPMLARVVERGRRAETVDQVVVATTTDPADDPVVDLCERRKFTVVRGDAFDVLDRYYQAARALAADVIVRVTGDCPLLDPEVVDRTVRALLESDPPADLALNRFVDDRTYPVGLDAEVCTIAALERAWREADQPYQREHVMPFLYDPPGRFRVIHVRNEEDYGDLRWTVDTAEDLELVRSIYAALAPDETFGWRQVLELIEAHPELAAINASVRARGLHEADPRGHKP